MINNHKKLPLLKILKNSFAYCLENWHSSAIFSMMFYVVGILAIWSWQSWIFLPIMVVFYIVWGVFFRVYFKRKPYLGWKQLLDSLVPSTKIVLLTVLIASLLVLLPLVPLFINISSEFNQKYALFLQGDIEYNGIILLVSNLLFLLISPLVAYRPFLAWISSLIGRSGSLRQAWEKTRHNYFEFLVISIWTDCMLSVARWAIIKLGGNDYMTMVIVAPVMVYFNVVSALAYEFFFLDKQE